MVSGAAMCSSPWEMLWNGDEDVATPKPFSLEAVSRWASSGSSSGSNRMFLFVFDSDADTDPDTDAGDEDVATPFHVWTEVRIRPS
jgi:hypothetical protein